MLEQTKRMSFRISSVLSKVEPEPGVGPLHRLRPKCPGSVSAKLTNIVPFLNGWKRYRYTVQCDCTFVQCTLSVKRIR